MGFFSSIKRLWSSNKPAETQETPQAPAEEALAAPQPAETEDGASHEESSVSDAPQSPVEVLEKLPETAAAELILNVALAIQHGLTIPKHHARLFIIDIQHDRRDLRMQLQKRFDKIIFRR